MPKNSKIYTNKKPFSGWSDTSVLIYAFTIFPFIVLFYRFLALFRKPPMHPGIKFGFRGEEIEYKTETNVLDVGSTWIDGRRIHIDSINHWREGAALTLDEKRKAFREIIEFAAIDRKEKPIIVMYTDGVDKTLWLQLCEEVKDLIVGIEYKTKAQDQQIMYNMLLDFINAGKTVNFDGIDFKSQKQLDKYWQRRKVV